MKYKKHDVKDIIAGARGAIEFYKATRGKGGREVRGLFGSYWSSDEGGNRADCFLRIFSEAKRGSAAPEFNEKQQLLALYALLTEPYGFNLKADVVWYMAGFRVCRTKCPRSSKLRPLHDCSNGWRLRQRIYFLTYKNRRLP